MKYSVKQKRMKMVCMRQEVYQETRLWDVDAGCRLRSMRGKEEAADYRYFPDPDLRPLVVTDEMVE